MTAGNTNYKVTYSNNILAGTSAKVEIEVLTDNTNYTKGTKISKTFTITKNTSPTITISNIANQTYTGSQIKPSVSVTVKIGSVTLQGSAAGTNSGDVYGYTISYGTNKNVGTGSVTVTLTGNNVGGSSTKNFNIVAKDASGATVTGVSSSYEYTGADIKPTPTVSGYTVNTDYTVKWQRNTSGDTWADVSSSVSASALGKLRVVISFKGNYTGTIYKEYTIVQKNMNGTLTDLVNKTYTGSAQTTTFTIDKKGFSGTLTEGSSTSGDYYVTYANNTSAGTATVTVTFRGNFTGTQTGTFTISKINIDQATMSISATSYNYSGAANTPGVKLLDKNGSTYLLGSASAFVTTGNTNYSVTYTNNTNAGTGTVTIKVLTNNTNYAQNSTVAKTFTINKINIDQATMSISATSYNYSGAANTPGVKLLDKNGSTYLLGSASAFVTTGNTNYSVTYTNNTNAGTGTVTIKVLTNSTNYNQNSTVAKTFTINKITLDKASLTLSQSTYTYSGSANTPGVKLLDKNGSTYLLGSSSAFATTGNTNYQLTYANNTNAGTGTVTIKVLTDSTNYTKNSTIAANFTINGLSIGSGSNFASTFGMNPTSIADQAYTGSAIEPAVTLQRNSADLTKGTSTTGDYYITYSNNISSGTASIVFHGRGNYSGTVTKTFNIVKVNLSNTVISINPSSGFVYEGRALTPAVTLKYNNAVVGGINGVTSSSDSNYSITYTNNTNAGTATVTVKVLTDSTNFTKDSTKAITFTIGKRAINNGTALASGFTYGGVNDSYDYTGSEIKPTPTLTYKNPANTNLTATFTSTYSNNTNNGTATVKITGTGNYSGEYSKTFAINKIALTNSRISISSISNSAYTGAGQWPTTTITDNGRKNSSGTTVTVTLTAGSGKDYNVAYYYKATSSGTYSATNEVKNAGYYKRIITASGNYSGTVETEFEITKLDLANAKFNNNNTITVTKTYNGSAQSVIAGDLGTVKINNYTLVSGTDYTINTHSRTNTGNTTVTITAAGQNITGTNNKITLTIAKATITSFTLSGGNATFDYAQHQNTVASIVTSGFTISGSNKLNNEGLADIVNTAYSFKNNSNVSSTPDFIQSGTYTVTITAKSSNYQITASGNKLELTYTISKRAITSGTTITYNTNTTTFTFDNNAHKVTVSSIKYGTNTLASGTDYNVAYSRSGSTTQDFTNSGSYVLTITAAGNNFSGSTTRTITINKMAFNTTNFSVAIKSGASWTYNSVAQCPTSAQVVVTNLKTGAVVDSSKYTVALDNDAGIAAGTHKYKVTVAANAIDNTDAGTISGQSFTIAQRAISETTGFTFTLSQSSYAYDGTEKKPTLSVAQYKNGSNAAVNVGHTLSYSGNVAVGTATVTITANDANFKGSTTRTFTITAISLNDVTLDPIDSPVTYNGYDQTPRIIMAYSGKTLVQDRDYTVVYKRGSDVTTDLTNVGTITIEITGTQNFSGSKTATLVIEAKDINLTTVEKVLDITYNTQNHAVNPKITDPAILGGTSKWDGSYTSTAVVAPTLLDGSSANSEANPYIIDTAGKLAYLSKNPSWGNGKYFKQTTNIDLDNKEWTGIDSGTPKYDGGSYTIYNLKQTVDVSKGYNYGLFKKLTGDSYIKSLTLDGVSITGNSSASWSANVDIGIFVAGVTTANESTFATLENLHAKNVVINFTSTTSTTNKSALCGGIVSWVQSAHIRNCSFDGSITMSGNRIARTGGIVGTLKGASDLENCSVSGQINTTSNISCDIGGIVGTVR